MVEWNDTAFPVKSRVKLFYAERMSKARPGVKLPACTLYWSEGGFIPDDERLAPIMKVLRENEKGEDPPNGCIFEGMLVGCMSQRLNRKLLWDGAKQAFDDKDANALMKPFIRPGWEF